MPEIIRGIEQGSPEWHALRLGSLGGSSLNAVLAKGQGKTRQALLYQLAAEILSGEKTETYTNQAMLDGAALEAEAREYYSFISGHEVEQVTLIKADIDRVHNSPDGLIGDDGGLEIKCPLPTTHIETIDTEKIDLKYIRQCQQFLWVSKRAYVDFISYCPKIKVKPMWVKRITPDAGIQGQIETELPVFLRELNELVERVKG